MAHNTQEHCNISQICLSSECVLYIQIVLLQPTVSPAPLCVVYTWQPCTHGCVYLIRCTRFCRAFSIHVIILSIRGRFAWFINYILRDCFTGTGAIVLPPSQWPWCIWLNPPATKPWQNMTFVLNVCIILLRYCAYYIYRSRLKQNAPEYS